MVEVEKKAVFLDRDGVLNRAVVRDGRPFPPANLQELAILPGVRPALEELKRHGFLLLVVTNQPDVARGSQPRAVVEEMHAVLRAKLPIDEFFVCYHDEADHCACRKPKPGLLVEAAAKYGLRWRDCCLIGDRWRDIDAAHAAGCAGIWLNHGYLERAPAFPPALEVKSLAEAVRWIIETAAGRDARSPGG